MAPRQPLNKDERRLLRITARMPLASAANLPSLRGVAEDRVRAMLGRLRGGGWVSSVPRIMTERRQHRFFLTSQAVDLLDVNNHQHPNPRDESRATAFHPRGELSAEFKERRFKKRFALDHDHPVHQEDRHGSPFNPSGPVGDGVYDGLGHEHPPWTATSLGVGMSLRRLAMLEPVYRKMPAPQGISRSPWNSRTSRRRPAWSPPLLRRPARCSRSRSGIGLRPPSRRVRCSGPDPR